MASPLDFFAGVCLGGIITASVVTWILGTMMNNICDEVMQITGDTSS